MRRISLLTLLLLASLVTLAQINLKNQDKGHQLDQEYSFDLEFPDGVDPLFQPDQLKAKGILDENPWVRKDPYALITSQQHLQILHPELDGYNMPVKTPDADINYSLLIFPPLLPEGVD